MSNILMLMYIAQVQFLLITYSSYVNILGSSTYKEPNFNKTNKQTNKQTKQTNKKQTNKQTNKQQKTLTNKNKTKTTNHKETNKIEINFEIKIGILTIPTYLEDG